MNRPCIIVLIINIILMFPGCLVQKKKQEPTNKKNSTKKQQSPSQQKTFTQKIEQLNFEEASQAREYYQSLNKKPQWAKSLERMIALSGDHQLIEKLLPELADVMFELEKYSEAEALYEQHLMLYPGSSQNLYIQARAIESAYRQILHASRDQSKTKKTIKSALLFLKNPKIPNTYKKQIKKILITCYYLILESETEQAAFYVQKNLYNASKNTLNAAKQRLIKIKREILPFIIEESFSEEQTKKLSIVKKELENIEEAESQSSKQQEQLSEQLSKNVQLLYTVIQSYQSMSPA